VTVTSVIAVAGAPGVAHASSDRVTAREATAALATAADLLTDTTDTSTSTATDAVVTDTVAIPRRAADGVEFNGLTIGLPGAADDAPCGETRVPGGRGPQDLLGMAVDDRVLQQERDE
jgi:hypothetical protein